MAVREDGLGARLRAGRRGTWGEGRRGTAHGAWGGGQSKRERSERPAVVPGGRGVSQRSTLALLFRFSKGSTAPSCPGFMGG